MKVICDIETNKLKDPDKIWCVVCKDINTREINVFTNDSWDAFRTFSSAVDCWIGHNFLPFDSVALFRILRVEIPYSRILDTLLLSRLFNYGCDGGHSLDQWGIRLGYPKPHITDFTKFSPELIDRCIADVEINYLVYKKFEPYLELPHYKPAIELEHQMLAVCNEMHRVGFAFNKERAEELHRGILSRLHELQSTFMREFKPEKVLVREFIARGTKSGELHKGDFRWYTDGDPADKYVPGSLVRIYKEVPFDPASPKQRIDRLWDAGWQPVEKTKTHIKTERDLRYCHDDTERDALRIKMDRFRRYGWKVNEENLSTLPASAPEGARALAQWITLDSRRQTLEEWLGVLGKDGRIHGIFNPIGAWSHRMSHQNPNTANIPSNPDIINPDNPTPVEQIKLDYNIPMRALWEASVGCLLIGCDATSIQLRMLAHYMGDKEYIDALLGNKDDVHGLNAIRLGIWDGTGELPPEVKYRAKRFIYAWLLGAGIAKIAEILHCSFEEAKVAVDTFVKSLPGLNALKEQQKEDYKRGYFIGLDGRYIPVPKDAPHKVMSGYLQSGEAIIMKRARIIWGTQLKKEKIWFNPVNFVHDEWQTEVKDDYDIAGYVARSQTSSITAAGLEFRLNIPLSGQYVIGRNWAESH